jgi:glycosyltransferase involved in cell wall biosynthesis
MFALQVAVMKGRGGILSAVTHYARMFEVVRVQSATLYRGPAPEVVRSSGKLIEAPASLTSPLYPLIPDVTLRRSVFEAGGGSPDIAIVHSDLALGAIKRLFPGVRVAAVSHSDKLKRKDRADLIVTLNGAQTAAVRAELPNVRVAQLGNPYVTPPPAALPPGDRPRLNFVARFIDTKQPLTLIEAVAKLGDRPALRFIGAGELEAEMRAALAAAGIDAEFTGWVSAPFERFHAQDILVLPSLWEGLPYLLQEALDHRAPIIASDNPGNRAALADGAYGALFTAGDAQALSMAIRDALANLDALRSKAEKGGAALRARYGAEAFWRALSTELGLVG